MRHLFIKFNGIVVNNENRMFIENCFQSIFSLAPSESTVSLNFFKTPDGFSGDLSIVSHTQNFEAGSEESTVLDVMKSLNSNVRNQLKEWKKQRFNIA